MFIQTTIQRERERERERRSKIVLPLAAALLSTLACCFATSALAAPITYADLIVEFIPGEGAHPENAPGDPLGPPDFDLSQAWGIGRGGTLTLRMGDWFSDVSGADLTVYEYGQSVGGANDPYEVYVSADANSWYSVGSSLGDQTDFDIAAVGASGPFRYVKILDADTSGMYDGADIDAVRAPEPATLSLVAVGIGAVMLRRRRK